MTATALESEAALPVAQSKTGLCIHCATALPSYVNDSFCCAGCRRVYDLLHDSDLQRYYDLRGENVLSPVTGKASVGVAPWLEDLENQEPHVKDASEGVRRFALDLQGIQCSACVWLIEALFRRHGDAYALNINPALGRAQLQVGPVFSLRDFVRTLEEFGYRVGPARKRANRESDALLLRTGACLLLAANTMFLSAAVYFGLREGPLFELVEGASLALATLSTLIGGSYFVRRAFLSLRRGLLHLDLPIAIGILLAYGGSVRSTLQGGYANYLDTVSIFIALMLVGRLVQERLIERNRRQLLESEGASGLLTRRISDGRSALVTCTQLAAGDELLVCPGEIVPVLSRLLSSRATCSYDWINGESEPKHLEAGSLLVAGAINAGQSAFRVSCETHFESSDLDTLLRSDTRREARRRGDFWDLVARYYVAFVLSAAGLGALIWTLRGADLNTVLDVATAVLVVTCPCAFGIATPLAYEFALSGLRRSGLYVREGSFFDRAAQVTRIVFDKTGTLTTGALSLSRPEELGCLTPSERRILYTLSSQSSHPKSHAVANALSRLDPTLELRDEEVVEVPSRGVEMVADAKLHRLGDARWACSDESAPSGSVYAVDGVQVLELPTREEVRPDAQSEAKALSSEGYELWIASGDSQERVAAMAARLEIPSHRASAGLTPEDKRAFIECLDDHNTLMLGDGINDGPALTEAWVSGTPAVDKPFVPARTDFYFLTAGLLPVRLALHTAKRVRRVVRNALWFASLYNVFVVTLCYANLMRPWLAALLMPASSLLVVAYAARALSSRRLTWKL